MTAREWKDRTGRVRWQPALGNGEALWRLNFFHEIWEEYRPPFGFEPALYRSRLRAERVAAREEHLRARKFRRA